MVKHSHPRVRCLRTTSGRHDRRNQYRGKGIGKALLARVAAIARQQSCIALRWQVLDWNTRAIEFYQELGAEFLDEWKTVNLNGEALKHMAAGAQ
jgi:ribosomal protein S18 acetylase RimI-like enzyme